MCIKNKKPLALALITSLLFSISVNSFADAKYNYRNQRYEENQNYNEYDFQEQRFNSRWWEKYQKIVEVGILVAGGLWAAWDVFMHRRNNQPETRLSSF